MKNALDTMKNGLAIARTISSIRLMIARTTEGTTRNCTMKKTIEDKAIETIFGEYGTGNDRKRMLGSDFEDVQTRVNQYYNIAEECTKGIWGFGWNRKNALEGAGYDPNIVQYILDRDYAERLDYNGC